MFTVDVRKKYTDLKPFYMETRNMRLYKQTYFINIYAAGFMPNMLNCDKHTVI